MSEEHHGPVPRFNFATGMQQEWKHMVSDFLLNPKRYAATLRAHEATNPEGFDIDRDLNGDGWRQTYAMNAQRNSVRLVMSQKLSHPVRMADVHDVLDHGQVEMHAWFDNVAKKGKLSVLIQKTINYRTSDVRTIWCREDGGGFEWITMDAGASDVRGGLYVKFTLDVQRCSYSADALLATVGDTSRAKGWAENAIDALRKGAPRQHKRMLDAYDLQVLGREQGAGVASVVNLKCDACNRPIFFAR